MLRQHTIVAEPLTDGVIVHLEAQLRPPLDRDDRPSQARLPDACTTTLSAGFESVPAHLTDVAATLDQQHSPTPCR